LDIVLKVYSKTKIPVHSISVCRFYWLVGSSDIADAEIERTHTHTHTHTHRNTRKSCTATRGANLSGGREGLAKKTPPRPYLRPSPSCHGPRRDKSLVAQLCRPAGDFVCRPRETTETASPLLSAVGTTDAGAFATSVVSARVTDVYIRVRFPHGVTARVSRPYALHVSICSQRPLTNDKNKTHGMGHGPRYSPSPSPRRHTDRFWRFSASISGRSERDRFQTGPRARLPISALLFRKNNDKPLCGECR